MALLSLYVFYGACFVCAFPCMYLLIHTSVYIQMVCMSLCTCIHTHTYVAICIICVYAHVVQAYTIVHIQVCVKLCNFMYANFLHPQLLAIYCMQGGTSLLCFPLCYAAVFLEIYLLLMLKKIRLLCLLYAILHKQFATYSIQFL